MSALVPAQPQPTGRAARALYLSHFTPSMMAPETLEAMLVQREPLLSRSLDHVVDSLRTGARHHSLFVGPRGIGKTHLISLLHHRLAQTAEARARARIAWMREEEWGVTSFFELVLRILRTLDASDPQLGIESRSEALYDLPPAEAEKQAESLLLEVVGDKCLVILLENLDDLFEQIGDQGQKAWRAFIQNHGNMLLVCTTPALFAGVSLHKSAFYGFFDIEPLAELSFNDVVTLLSKIAQERGDSELAAFLDSPEGRARVRAVHHLAEGNPRIYIIFAQFLSTKALDELVTAFMHTLDELTPYYQARMKERSGQQRKILEYLIQYRGAAPVKQIAKACFITQQTCSSQLKQLREYRFVRSIEQGRESHYELCEPLMRLSMDVKKQRGEPVELIVDMIRIWFTEEQMQGLLTNSDHRIGLYESYLKKALEISTTEQLEPKVVAVIRDVSQASNAKAARELLYELTELNIKNAQINRVKSVIRFSFPERYLISNFSDLEISAGVKDLISLANSIPSLKQSTHVVYKMLLPLLISSANLYANKREHVGPLFEALLAVIAKYPAEGAVATIRVLGSPGADENWLQALMSCHPSGFLSREMGMLSKRLTRISKAWAEAVVSKNQSSLLQLPKEERSLVEMLIQAKQVTSTNQ